MSKFWEIEELQTPITDPENDACESYFCKTVCRNSEGRYIVRLPFKESAELGDSRMQAIKRFMYLENKLEKQPKHKELYHEFMSEYIRLGHMSITSESSKYIIPHHAVFKLENGEPKIRVVFDASAKTSNAKSLNELLHSGIKLQLDIAQVITNFRQYAVAFMADITKMYRQVLINEHDKSFQHIFWRFDASEPIRTYKLNTVTYGMSSAPFLALRVLQQLILDEGLNFPNASNILRTSVYVDDIAAGASSLEQAINLKNELIVLLSKGGFSLHKWKCNSPEFLQSIEADSGPSDIPFSFNEPNDASTKILGLLWYAKSDVFSYKVANISPVITKRSILSTIAKLYDPLGFLQPVIFLAKVILQKLWSINLDWDEEVPDPIRKAWKAIVTQLPNLTTFTVPRLIFPATTGTKQLFTFCDASQRGYAAVTYLRFIDCDNKVTISLLCSKTKLAPLKVISIPRLELLAAHLSVKLVKSLHSFILCNEIRDIFYFSDSSVVLNWLQIPPSRLKIFVANRVCNILSTTSIQQWFHISSKDNPADIASRGMLPNVFITNKLWLNGPPFIHIEPIIWPAKTRFTENLPEIKQTDQIFSLYSAIPDFAIWINRFSNYSRLIHSVGYVLRFVNNTRPSNPRFTGDLSCEENQRALTHCIYWTQNEHFSQEFDYLKRLPLTSRLLSLNIFLDSDDLLRVGGRLNTSPLSSDVKNPIILPNNSPFTIMLVKYYHLVNFHLGNKALQAYLQRRYWIFKIRTVVRKCINDCIVCRKHKTRPTHPLMGDLPPSRSAQGRPFTSAGVDYAGPFSIKTNTRRNAPITKAYLCLFVCMSTKAVHLEVVSSLSTESFISALKRFISRRGCPTQIFSDNGTNFVAANKLIKEWFIWLSKDVVQSEITGFCTKHEFKWIFNPPSAPHFGGLWEAAVKSAKFHLHRIIKDHATTFEELTTLFVRIEAILNSRPLCAVSNSLEDYDYLTPGHFLIGAPITSFPEQNITETPLNRLSRWQLIQASTQHFWKRWTNEYLTSLQHRTKWTKAMPSMKVGDLVLVMEKNQSLLKWTTARIDEIFPGSDNTVRVVKIKTATGSYVRPVSKLAPLITDTDN